VKWDTSASGVLCIATNQSLRYYDTRINPSRPTLTRMTNSRSGVQSIAFPPRSTHGRSETRMIAVEMNGAVRDLPLHQVSPVAISSRDGRISSSVSGGVVWAGQTTEGT